MCISHFITYFPGPISRYSATRWLFLDNYLRIKDVKPHYTTLHYYVLQYNYSNYLMGY